LIKKPEDLIVALINGKIVRTSGKICRQEIYDNIVPDWWDRSCESDPALLQDLQIRASKYLGVPLKFITNLEQGELNLKTQTVWAVWRETDSDPSDRLLSVWATKAEADSAANSLYSLETGSTNYVVKELLVHSTFNENSLETFNPPNNAPWWEQVKVPAASMSYSNVDIGAFALRLKAAKGHPHAIVRSGDSTLNDLEHFNSFLKNLTNKFKDLKLTLLNQVDKRTTRLYYLTQNTALDLEFNTKSQVLDWSVATSDISFSNDLAEFFKTELPVGKPPKGSVFALLTSDSGPYFSPIGIAGEKLERGNYSEEVIKGYDRIVTDLNSNKPAGRIGILMGTPGSGKSFLIRGLLDEVTNANFVIVQPNMVSQLAEPSIINALIELHQDGEAPIVFIIEDADEVLSNRSASNMSAISSTLNLSDGLLGKLLDIRMIATTNADRQDIDSAIKRPGRLSAFVEVGELSEKQACEVFLRLTGKEAYKASYHPHSLNSLHKESQFHGGATLAEVYSAARQDGWVPAPSTSKNKIGF
jgi:hypothetical protein